MNGEVRVWEIRSKEMISNLKEHIQRVSKVQVFSDDLHLLTAAKDKSILVWDLAKEKRVSSYQVLMGGVNNFQISPVDQNLLITVGQDRKITQWDLRHTRPVRIICSDPYNKLDKADELFGIAISNDGKHLATGGTGGVIRLWDIYNGLSFYEENYAHSNNITGLAYTYDDRFLISSAEDSMILSFKNKI